MFFNESRKFIIVASVYSSRLAVASSKHTIGLAASATRVRLIICFSPSDRFVPDSSIRKSNSLSFFEADGDDLSRLVKCFKIISSENK